MISSEKKTKKTLYRGVVVSDGMDKTIVVEHERTYSDERVHKVMRTVKKYKVHDENEQASVGDVVEFYEGRPASKTKYMYLARVVKSEA
ncbi:MAG: 30S ribosomal protein S17 [Mycobacteriaceae bacterium]|nr:30S ribosomal protein S17 [Mycobacteriaceae bacterium]